jgi:N-acetylglutamate synthase-like GNAT family acetyltransferase
MASQTLDPTVQPAPTLEHTVEEVRCYSLTFREDGTVIGRAQLHASSSHCLEIVDLFVEPAFRGNGHARRIIAGLANFARGLGAAELCAHTSADNGAAFRAFADAGFSICHEEVHLERPISAKQTADVNHRSPGDTNHGL